MIGFEIGAWFWTLLDSALMLTDRREVATPVVPDPGFGVHVGRTSEPTPRPRFSIERRAYLREEELQLQVHRTSPYRPCWGPTLVGAEHVLHGRPRGA